MQAVEAVAREVRHEAGLGQALLQVVAGLALVFYNQDFHRPSLWQSSRMPIVRATSPGFRRLQTCNGAVSYLLGAGKQDGGRKQTIQAGSLQRRISIRSNRSLGHRFGNLTAM